MQLYLIGFMGSGKSFLGKKLAEYWQVDFYDLDLLLEAKYGKSISEMFREKGEAWFRQQESELLLSWQKSGIIACGGGVIELEINRDFLKNKSVVCLDADWQTLWQRIEASTRPLVKDLGESGGQNLYNLRREKYLDCANCVIESSTQLAENIELLSREINSICSS